MIIKLEFSEEQQAFHFNYGDHTENSNTYFTIKEGSYEELMPITEKLKDIRNSKKLTLDEVKKIILKNE
jgi:hypothetical protein